MRQELTLYLESIGSRLRVDPRRKQEILRELSTHLEERVEELRLRGMEEAEALRQAVAQLGSPSLVAEALYRCHSQGGWRQAFMAALPHFLVALSFALHRWQSLSWLLFLLVSIVIISLWGWWRGKPIWLFPWLGYFIIPILGVSLFLLALPPWSYLAFIAYIPLAWWLLSSIAIQAVKRDWLYGTLVLLPFPVLAAWILALEFQGWLGTYIREGLVAADPWIALSFVTLGLTSATFVRASQRRLKAGALLTPELVILVLVALGTGSLGAFLGLSLLAVLSLALLLSPALLEKRGMGDGKRRPG